MEAEVAASKGSAQVHPAPVARSLELSDDAPAEEPPPQTWEEWWDSCTQINIEDMHLMLNNGMLMSSLMLAFTITLFTGTITNRPTLNPILTWLLPISDSLTGTWWRRTIVMLDG